MLIDSSFDLDNFFFGKKTFAMYWNFYCRCSSDDADQNSVSTSSHGQVNNHLAVHVFIHFQIKDMWYIFFK